MHEHAHTNPHTHTHMSRHINRHHKLRHPNCHSIHLTTHWQLMGRGLFLEVCLPSQQALSPGQPRSSANPLMVLLVLGLVDLAPQPTDVEPGWQNQGRCVHTFCLKMLTRFQIFDEILCYLVEAFIQMVLHYK